MTNSAPPPLGRNTANSSMKVRMRKMPRPEVFSRFSSSQRIRNVGEVEAAALVEDMDDKLVFTTRARQQDFLLALLLVAVANRVDDALAHGEANFLTVVFAESARLSGAQTDLFGSIDAFKQRLQGHFNPV